MLHNYLLTTNQTKYKPKAFKQANLSLFIYLSIYLYACVYLYLTIFPLFLTISPPSYFSTNQPTTDKQSKPNNNHSDYYLDENHIQLYVARLFEELRRFGGYWAPRSLSFRVSLFSFSFYIYI